jgi:hypothetical protein
LETITNWKLLCLRVITLANETKLLFYLCSWSKIAFYLCAWSKIAEWKRSTMKSCIACNSLISAPKWTHKPWLSSKALDLFDNQALQALLFVYSCFGVYFLCFDSFKCWRCKIFIAGLFTLVDPREFVCQRLMDRGKRVLPAQSELLKSSD